MDDICRTAWCSLLELHSTVFVSVSNCDFAIELISLLPPFKSTNLEKCSLLKPIQRLCSVNTVCCSIWRMVRLQYNSRAQYTFVAGSFSQPHTAGRLFKFLLAASSYNRRVWEEHGGCSWSTKLTVSLCVSEILPFVSSNELRSYYVWHVYRLHVGIAV